MIDPDEATKSYFNFVEEEKDKTKESCEQASKDVKDALKTISFESSKMKDLLEKLSKE